MSKKILFFSCIDIVISPNNMYFVLYGKDKLFLFNSLNLNYVVRSDFSGNINSVAINSNGQYILISTDYIECPLYLIYHSSLNFFKKNSYMKNEYDIDQVYIHQDYSPFHKVFSLSFGKGFIIQKMQLNYDQNRLLVLYSNSEGLNLKNVGMLFQIDFNADINNFSIEFLIPINSMNGQCLTNFEATFNLQREIESFLMVWNDKLLGNFYIYPAKA